MTTFGQRIQGRDNNFDFLRFALAAAVLFSHSFVQLYGLTSADPLAKLTHDRAYIGELAVNGFFIISGFLIATSWVRSKGWLDFLKKRVARIFPGYIVVTLICATLVAYLGGVAAHDLMKPRYGAMTAARIATFSFMSIPGAFQGLPYAENVNGSLWTIRYEFECYLMVMVMGLITGFRKRWTVVVLAAIALSLYVAQATIGQVYAAEIAVDPKTFHPRLASLLYAGMDIPGPGNPMHWPRFVGCFALGMILTFYKDVIPYTGKLALAALVLTAISCLSPIAFAAVMPICLTYLVFYVAFNPTVPFQRFGKYGDFSYGLYLYAWPIQQLLYYHFGAHFNPYTHALTAFLLTMPLAFLSWHLVEKPFLKKAHQPKPEPRGFDPVLKTTADAANPTVAASASA